MFKNKLVEYRKLNKDTQESLAKKINVSRSLIAKWEQGRAYPNEEDLENLSTYFNIELDSLISSKELKEIYGITLKKGKIKSKVIVCISFISIVAITLSIVFGLRNNHITYINEGQSNINIELIEYKNVNNEVSPLVGKEEAELLFNNEFGYAYDWFTIERYKFTEVSSLLLLYYRVEVTPGLVAHFNGHEEYNKDTLIKRLNISDSFIFDQNLHHIISWPKRKEQSGKLQSRYSNNYVFNENLDLYGLKLNNLSYYYDGNIMDIIMDNSYLNQVAILNSSWFANNTNSEVELEIIDEIEKKKTLAFNFYHLIEVKDSALDCFRLNQSIKIDFCIDNKIKQVNKSNNYTFSIEY